MGRNNHYRYFRILQGLRGCYMPDQNSVIQVSSRRELKEHLVGECDMIDNGEGDVVGISKRMIAWAANHAWSTNNAILPWGFKGQSAGKPYSIDISRASRSEYLEFQRDECGATMVEYALIAGIGAIVLITCLHGVVHAINAVFTLLGGAL